MKRKEIFRVLSENRDRIAELGAKRLALFGSHAREEASPSSDLDFLVEFERKSFDGYMDLKALLEALFQHPVDLVIADALKPALRERILKEAVDAPGF